MIEELLTSIVNTPITPDNKYLLVVGMFVLCFGIESLIELFGTFARGFKKL